MHVFILFIHGSHELKMTFFLFYISTDWRWLKSTDVEQKDISDVYTDVVLPVKKRSEQTFQSRTTVATFRFTACCPRLDWKRAQSTLESTESTLQILKSISLESVLESISLCLQSVCNVLSCFVMFCIVLSWFCLFRFYIGSLWKFGNGLHCLHCQFT